MNRRRPILSVGLPVYNGENYLMEALDCLLAQTMEDFELIICDNASTDATEQICRDAMEKDARIQYLKNESNIGASGNYTRVFERASGQYFRWAAHDDVCDVRYHECCLEVLESDRGISLCYAMTNQVTPDKRVLWQIPSNPDLFDNLPDVRLRGCLAGGEVQMIWGVMRREQLAQTRLLGNYTAHDRPLVAEMCMRGRLHEIKQPLYCLRDHGERSIRKYGWKDMHAAIEWFDPARAGKLTFPWWRLLGEFTSAVRRSPVVGEERRRCYREIAGWANVNRANLFNDLKNVSYDLPMVGSRLKRRRERNHEMMMREWDARRDALIAQINSCIPEGNAFYFNDGEALDLRTATSGELCPFPNQDGFFSGYPADDAEAVAAWEQSRDHRPRYFVVPWTVFWWFDQYPEFHRILRDGAEVLSKSDNGVVYYLRGVSNGEEPKSQKEWSFQRQ